MQSSEPSTGGLVVVTGGASGIGEHLAREFAGDGHDLVLVDRDEAGMESVATSLETAPGDVVETVAVDLTEPDAPDRVYDRIDSLDGHVETLVNNAGAPVYGEFADTEWDQTRTVIRLNVEALTALTHRFVDDMRERGHGRICNTASLAGTVPTPTAAVYGATKAYVLSFSVALSEELADDGITVTALCPGETQTPFMNRGGMDQSAVAGGDLMAPETVARAGYEGAMAGKRVVVPGWRNRLRYHFSKLLPRRVTARLSRRVWSGSS